MLSGCRWKRRLRCFASWGRFDFVKRRSRAFLSPRLPKRGRGERDIRCENRSDVLNPRPSSGLTLFASLVLRVGVVVPHLLVSVRDREEAVAAMTGGCDILAVKEPLAGALGRADWATIVAIAEAATASQIPVSAAFGELSDWLSLSPAMVAGPIRSSLNYAKLGLAQTVDLPGLAARWTSVLNALQRDCVGQQTRWVAVVYADWQAAFAPSPLAVLALVDELRARHDISFAGLLVDTYTKTDKRLLDCLSVAELATLRDAAHERQLLFAVAGRLRMEDVAKLPPIEPDIVAIRSAACADGSRMNSVQAESVARFKAELQRCFGRS